MIWCEGCGHRLGLWRVYQLGPMSNWYAMMYGLPWHTVCWYAKRLQGVATGRTKGTGRGGGG